ncbi:MAG: molybdopterin-dependent oxidoreductase [Rhodospirillaceae bacterium]|nr:molybdopterin-dependent oxidoreductase [Rhodospirillaceae bacterium]MBT4941289.1 molybdopterin-dependent oxidoreductase [Rhodospirillaceae bacterium]
MVKINRRNFMKLSGTVATAAAAYPTLVKGMELELGGQDFHQIRTFHPRERSAFLCTMCPYFDGGFAYAENGEIKKTEGNPDHIATRGKFCTKGLSSFFAASDPDRILKPLKRVGKRGEGKWQQIGWNEAIAEVAAKIGGALDEPNSIYLNEGSFKEGVGVRFMDTLGSSSVIRSRIPGIGCTPKQITLEKMLGVNFVFPDLEKAKFVLNFGNNILETAFPLAQRLTDGIVNNRLKLVTFDTRMSNTAGRSDEWFSIFPGSDGIIALAMANEIMQRGLADVAFIDKWTNYDSAKLAAELKQFTPKMASKASGVPAKVIRQLAVEFAKTKPAAVLSLNGVSWHRNGIDGEMACLLLAVITGNIDNEGGVCLPRKFDIAEPQPAPSPLGGKPRKMTYNYTFPFEVKEGAHRVQILFNHMSNPAYSSPASSFWREVMGDEKLIPYLVDFSPFMSESAELADIILPDLVAVERYDLASSPTALLPWAGMTVPPVKPRGSARDVRETVKKIIEKVDADGSRGMKQYWAFSNARDWVKKEVEATAPLKKRYKKLRSKGVWPSYGKIDPATRQIIRKGEPVTAEYKTYQKSGFATPSGKIEITAPAWSANPRHAAMGKNEFVLTTFKVAYHTLSMTSNLKYLAELWHSNPLWINWQAAKEMGIKDGENVRVTSDVGYMVTQAWLTNGIHPHAVGISTSVGRSAYGRVALADPDERAPFVRREHEDPDIEDNIWWRDGGVNPNDIIPITLDPQSGVQAWNDTVVKITPAKFGDRYGDIKVSNAKHLAIYRKLLGQS